MMWGILQLFLLVQSCPTIFKASKKLAIRGFAYISYRISPALETRVCMKFREGTLHSILQMSKDVAADPRIILLTTS